MSVSCILSRIWFLYLSSCQRLNAFPPIQILMSVEVGCQPGHCLQSQIPSKRKKPTLRKWPWLIDCILRLQPRPDIRICGRQKDAQQAGSCLHRLWVSCVLSGSATIRFCLLQMDHEVHCLRLKKLSYAKSYAISYAKASKRMARSALERFCRSASTWSKDRVYQSPPPCSSSSQDLRRHRRLGASKAHKVKKNFKREEFKREFFL